MRQHYPHALQCLRKVRFIGGGGVGKGGGVITSAEGVRKVRKSVRMLLRKILKYSVSEIAFSTFREH